MVGMFRNFLGHEQRDKAINPGVGLASVTRPDFRVLVDDAKDRQSFSAIAASFSGSSLAPSFSGAT